MADQTIRIENMPDSGSAEAVAFQIWSRLRDKGATIDDQLKFFTRCITAVKSTDPSYYDMFSRRP